MNIIASSIRCDYCNQIDVFVLFELWLLINDELFLYSSDTFLVIWWSSVVAILLVQ